MLRSARARATHSPLRRPCCAIRRRSRISFARSHAVAAARRSPAREKIDVFVARRIGREHGHLHRQCREPGSASAAAHTPIRFQSGLTPRPCTTMTALRVGLAGSVYSASTRGRRAVRSQTASPTTSCGTICSAHRVSRAVSATTAAVRDGPSQPAQAADTERAASHCLPARAGFAAAAFKGRATRATHPGRSPRSALRQQVPHRLPSNGSLSIRSPAGAR